MPADTPDPRAWRVAIALTLALPEPLDWARWASGMTVAPHCPACFGVGHPMLYTDGDANRLLGCLRPSKCVARPVTPVPAPWDTAAYLADCERRGVEPGPLPALEYDDGRVRWKVFGVGRQIVVGLRVGKFRGSVWSDGDMFVSTADESPASVHDHPDFSSMATAAAKAMAQP